MSADMDAAIQRNPENHGVSMAIAPAGDKVDMNVTYTDSWFWDIVDISSIRSCTTPSAFGN
jgi:hypothetical protein